jgi:hypothetical protein
LHFVGARHALRLQQQSKKINCKEGKNSGIRTISDQSDYLPGIIPGMQNILLQFAPRTERIFLERLLITK